MCRRDGGHGCEVGRRGAGHAAVNTSEQSALTKVGSRDNITIARGVLYLSLSAGRHRAGACRLQIASSILAPLQIEQDNADGGCAQPFSSRAGSVAALQWHTIAVLIPCYNEGRSIAKVVAERLPSRWPCR
jgi:hypothetical protein